MEIGRLSVRGEIRRWGLGRGICQMRALGRGLEKIDPATGRAGRFSYSIHASSAAYTRHVGAIRTGAIAGIPSCAAGRSRDRCTTGESGLSRLAGRSAYALRGIRGPQHCRRCCASRLPEKAVPLSDRTRLMRRVHRRPRSTPRPLPECGHSHSSAPRQHDVRDARRPHPHHRSTRTLTAVSQTAVSQTAVSQPQYLKPQYLNRSISNRSISNRSISNRSISTAVSQPQYLQPQYLNRSISTAVSQPQYLKPQYLKPQ